MNAKPTAVRVQAARTLADVIGSHGSLSNLLKPAQQSVRAEEQALLSELCFGTLRWYPQLLAILNRLLSKPLRDKDTDVQALLLLGLYQLIYMRTPDHAVISECVDGCRPLGKPWANKLVNGVLREFQRQQEPLESALAKSPAYVTAHPNWLRKSIEQHWPVQATDIFDANNQYPPFTIRVNASKVSRQKYLEQLQQAGIAASATDFSPWGITLQQAVDVTTLPGFDQGVVSVQDEAAQLAAELLQMQPGQRALDACCAPGGKTGHMLEVQPELQEVVAIDVDARRMERVKENLDRLNVNATMLVGDAADVSSWWDGTPFDRILLDAPCSATGVIRRHPDIKVLRKANDIAKLAALQLSLLEALWPTLKAGGQLLYATCSILPTENTRVIEQFAQQHEDVRVEPIAAAWGLEQNCGRQLFPTNGGHDGFYYARLSKI